MNVMPPPEVALERSLHEKQCRGEKAYAHILGRVTVEDLQPNHFHRWLVEWMNLQLSDIGANSTGGQVLPPLHFDLVRVRDNVAAAHLFETEEFVFVVVTQPMVDEMLTLSLRLVDQNRAFMSLQIAPSATLHDIAHFLVLLQFCFVTSHEYSHLVRRHLEDDQPHAAEIGESLRQTQELDADGYGIYHELAYFFNGAGRQFVSQSLKISNPSALENSILSCFLLAMMIQFCARWAGKFQMDSDLGVEHPPPPMRIKYAILFVEMWCREVGGISTTWMTDGTLRDYFGAAARLFPAELKTSWDHLMWWLKSPESEQYRVRIQSGLDRLRTGTG